MARPTKDTKSMNVKETTFPGIGETKFTGPIDSETAHKIAAHLWDNVVSVSPCHDKSGPYYAVELSAGYCAMIGTIEGKPSVLVKMDGQQYPRILYTMENL